jgi:hypothetical protein
MKNNDPHSETEVAMALRQLRGLAENAYANARQAEDMAREYNYVEPARLALVTADAASNLYAVIAEQGVPYP